MRAKLFKYTAAIIVSLVPGIALAQHIPVVIAVAALSPLLVMLCAVVLGALEHNWKTGAKHLGMIIIWIALFAVASYNVENDYIIWTPMLLYVLHAILIIALIFKQIVGRIKSKP